MHERISQGTSEGCYQHLGSCSRTEVLSDLAQTDRGVCSDSWLFVVGGSGELLQQITVDGAVSKFGDDNENGFECLLSYYRGSICESSRLQKSALVPHQYR